MHAKSSQTLKTRSVVGENSEDHAGASHNPTVIYCTSIKTRISQENHGSHPSIIIFKMILLQFLIYKWFQCLTHSRYSRNPNQHTVDIPNNSRQWWRMWSPWATYKLPTPSGYKMLSLILSVPETWICISGWHDSFQTKCPGHAHLISVFCYLPWGQLSPCFREMEFFLSCDRLGLLCTLQTLLHLLPSPFSYWV